jgi:dephospho-CoA kinase
MKDFENRVLKRLFGPTGDEIIIAYKKLDREKLRNLYFSPNIIRLFKS